MEREAGMGLAAQPSLRTQGREYILYMLEGSRHNLDLIRSTTGRP